MSSLEVKRSEKTGKPKTGRPAKYDWRTWADGSWWQTSGNGKELLQFRSAAHKAANRMDLHLETEIRGRFLYFRFREFKQSA